MLEENIHEVKLLQPIIANNSVSESCIRPSLVATGDVGTITDASKSFGTFFFFYTKCYQCIIVAADAERLTILIEQIRIGIFFFFGGGRTNSPMTLVS